MHRKGNLHQLGVAFEFKTKRSKVQIIMSTLLTSAAQIQTLEIYFSLGAEPAIIPEQTIPAHSQMRWPFYHFQQLESEKDSLLDF